MRKSKRKYSYNAAELSPNNKKIVNLIDYEQPMYENLTDSIQIREEMRSGIDANVSLIRFNNQESDNDLNSSSKKNHINPPSKEWMNIHRSDSGISNSSYEHLPHALSRTNQYPKPKRHHSTAPVYINIPYVSNKGNSSHSNTQSVHGNLSGEVSKLFTFF